MSDDPDEADQEPARGATGASDGGSGRVEGGGTRADAASGTAREPEPGSEANDREAIREAVERSRHGAPAVGAAVRDRFSADEVFQRIVAAADEEVTADGRELFFSGLAAGLAITITYLLYASVTAATDGHPILSALLYPLGFVYIIVGGYQLYTENTLPPVALTLERLASLPALLRHWTVVLAGNFTGGALGAIALTWGGVFSPDAAAAATDIATKGVETAPTSLFFKAVFAGLIVAGVVWVGFATTDTISRTVIVYLAFLAIPLGGLFHVVVSFTEVLYLVFAGRLDLLTGLTGFVLPVLAGNTAGGVVLVTVVNYFQTTEDRLESARFEGSDRQLSLREWTLGGFIGRSYVPLVDTGQHPTADAEGRRIMVAIANPRAESYLVDLACTIARGEEGATVHAVHVVQTPRGRAGRRASERITAASRRQLEDIRAVAGEYDIPFETSTVISHRSFEEAFDVAARDRADLVVMSWDDTDLWAAGRSRRSLHELARGLPCDLLVSKGQTVDASRILLPTAGGADSDLAAEVVRALRTAAGSAVSLLHVVDGAGELEAGERFLDGWATDHGLGDAATTVDESGDVETAIREHAADHTLAVIGATDRGLLWRLLTDSLHIDAVEEVDCSVLLVERPGDRGLLDRLLGQW